METPEIAPTGISELVAAKLKVTKFFSKALLHFDMSTKQNTITISNDNTVFSKVITQLEQQGYVLPADFNFTFTVQKPNFRKPLSEKINSKTLLAEQEGLFEMSDDFDSAEEYEGELITSDSFATDMDESSEFYWFNARLLRA